RSQHFAPCVLLSRQRTQKAASKAGNKHAEFDADGVEQISQVHGLALYAMLLFSARGISRALPIVRIDCRPRRFILRCETRCLRVREPDKLIPGPISRRRCLAARYRA